MWGECCTCVWRAFQRPDCDDASPLEYPCSLPEHPQKPAAKLGVLNTGASAHCSRRSTLPRCGVCGLRLEHRGRWPPARARRGHAGARRSRAELILRRALRALRSNMPTGAHFPQVATRCVRKSGFQSARQPGKDLQMDVVVVCVCDDATPREELCRAFRFLGICSPCTAIRP